jgi:phage gp36-like protein
MNTTNYATSIDFLRLGLPDRAAAAQTSAEVEAMLGAASRLADSYLRKRYALPLRGWDEALTRAVCAIAAYDALSRRGMNPENLADANIRMRYDDAIKWLKCVAEGDFSPDIEDGSVGDVAGPGNSMAVVMADAKRGW